MGSNYTITNKMIEPAAKYIWDEEPKIITFNFPTGIIYGKFEYEKVIFNPPATVVIWSDKTKTVVKCSDGDKFDFEKGLALCFMKKALGNTSGALNKVLHKETENRE